MTIANRDRVLAIGDELTRRKIIKLYYKQSSNKLQGKELKEFAASFDQGFTGKFLDIVLPDRLFNLLRYLFKKSLIIMSLRYLPQFFFTLETRSESVGRIKFGYFDN